MLARKDINFRVFRKMTFELKCEGHVVSRIQGKGSNMGVNHQEVRVGNGEVVSGEVGSCSTWGDIKGSCLCFRWDGKPCKFLSRGLV
jgi:hypothetical protein